MAVKVGSARADERGKASGGQAGDQTGREVSAQNWYRHSKGWRVLRANEPAKAAKIAQCMRAACENNNIGYDQGQRNTLYNVAKSVGFDCARINTKCETDCSALVRVCCAYAGIMAPDFNTSTQAAALKATGEFDVLTAPEYTDKSDNLRVGDVLVTKTKGHTAVVVQVDAVARPTLRKGSKGADVKTLQNLLIARGYALPKYGADGDFGDETDKAVRAYQRVAKLTVDGIVGTRTWQALAEPPERLYRFTLTLADKAALEALRGQYGGEITEVER